MIVHLDLGVMGVGFPTLGRRQAVIIPTAAVAALVPRLGLAAEPTRPAMSLTDEEMAERIARKAALLKQRQLDQDQSLSRRGSELEVFSASVALLLAAPIALLRRPRKASKEGGTDAISRLDEGSLAATSEFFVDAFWSNGTTFVATPLTDADRRQLTKQVANSFRQRYLPARTNGGGGRARASLLPSTLLVARSADGTVEGCAGIEAAVLDVATRQLLVREEAEARMRAAVDEAVALGDTRYANLTAVELAATLFPKQRVVSLSGPHTPWDPTLDAPWDPTLFPKQRVVALHGSHPVPCHPRRSVTSAH